MSKSVSKRFHLTEQHFLPPKHPCAIQKNLESMLETCPFFPLQPLIKTKAQTTVSLKKNNLKY